MLPSAESLEGRSVPQVTFKTRTDDQWEDIFINGELIGNANELEVYLGARKAA